ncbi:CCHC-type domain-containing protein [Citrus sinensis]|nr:CCHC-type domain-containing protein [Citrus sinensis]
MATETSDDVPYVPVSAPTFVKELASVAIPVNHAEMPEKFNGQNFKRWQQKMFFYLTTLNLARFLTEDAPKPKEGETDIQVMGHKASDCRLPKKKREANVVENITQHVSDINLSAVVLKVNLVGSNPREWWIDTGATRHVCSDKGLFTLFEVVNNGEKLFMGNSATSEIESQGKVILKMTSGKELTLNNVLYVPEIRKNLVSGSLLNKHGFRMVFESDRVVLSKNGMYVGKGYVDDRLFKLNVMTLKPTINNKATSSAYLLESSNLWHGRLGHVNFNSLRKLINMKHIPNFQIDLKHKCETCVEAKLTRKIKEAVTSAEGTLWKEAINSEVEFILQNHTWELVDLFPGCKPLGYKWIFKRKMKADGSIDKYKARLVIKGYRQREGIGYFDTYSPITRINSIRMIIAIAALCNLEIHQMDVKTTFLNGDLDEEIYMEQPESFIAPGQKKKVCKLVKSLYGLKQAPKQWHEKFDHTMITSGFKINECDKYVYVKET